MHFLLDSHIPKAVAVGLSHSGRAVRSVHLSDWHGGQHRNEDDDQLLDAANAEGLTLVTYDVRTIQPLLADMATRGQHHAGVIFVDDRSIAQNDVGGLVRALAALIESEGELDWRDRVVYLRPVRR